MKSKRILSGLLVALMLLVLMPNVALAADHSVSDGETFDLNNASDGDTVRVEAGAVATIIGGKNVTIECGAGVMLFLDTVDIDVSAVPDACALSFTGTGNALILTGDATLKSGKNEPGIRVEDTTALEISGEGILTAAGGADSAGIGGGFKSSGGTIEILSGNIYATGGDAGGAGIGSGDGDVDINGYTGGKITISGGNVTATGGEYGAGIGGGDYVDGGITTITGGNIKAVSTNGAAGIGGGYKGDSGTIKISGGYIEAISSEDGAGIGSGEFNSFSSINSAGDITIEGDAEVVAFCGSDAAGIGGGSYSSGGKIVISGNAKVTATGGYEASGIGGGCNGSGGDITITGNAQIKATGGEYAAGIGGGDYGDSGSITISDKTNVTAKGGYKGAGIGGGEDGSGKDISIKGGKITATGGEYAAGIGGGVNGVGEKTVIEGGTITAIGGDSAAGIGGGNNGDGGTIHIDGGIVYAIKDENGSYDIGKGLNGNDGYIFILGNAAVFLGTNSISPSPSTNTHIHYEFTEDTQQVYGIEVPEEWTPMFGAYLVLCDLVYDANGGTGDGPAVTELAAGINKEVLANQFTREGYLFDYWNTKADGSGNSYDPGDEITIIGDTTLYAQWIERVDSIKLNKSSISLYKGQTYLLTAYITPSSSKAEVTWTSSNDNIAVVIDGKVYSIGKGSAVIKAEAMGKTATCTVNVKVSDTSDDDDNNNTPSATETPAPTSTPEPTESPEPTETPEAEQAGNLETFIITLSNLPDGTLAVILPDDRVIRLTGETTEIEIDSKYIKNGEIELIALDENIPLASGEEIEISKTNDTRSSGMKAWLWVLIGLAGAGAIGVAVYLILKKSKGEL